MGNIINMDLHTVWFRPDLSVVMTAQTARVMPDEYIFGRLNDFKSSRKSVSSETFDSMEG
jgi:hypothetical protein